jgi:very-short-patch-repair endonuclease
LHIMPTPNSNTKITQIAPRLVDLLEYVEHMVRLTERPVFSIRDHKNLLYFEHELQGRIGIYHDQQDENGSIWLKIDRLKRIDPPDVPEEIKAWVTVSRDPARAPQVLESRMETVSETEVRALVEKGIVNTEDVSKALKQSQFGPKMFDVFLRLEQQLELRSVIEAYITGPWKTWADTERPRRETIRIYEQFFSLHQAIQSEGVEHPVEIVWGVGLALLKLEDQTIEQPLIEALVEIELDEHGGAVLIRPRDVPLQLGLKPFYALDNPGAEVIQRGAREFFAKLEREEKEFSPFIGETFEPVLRLATSQLQEAAVYHPDDVKDKTNRTIPAVSSTLRITDSWAVYARRRSDNFLVEDLERLKKAVRETDAAEIPAAAQRFVTELSDEKVYRPTLINLGGGFSGGSGFGRGSGSDGDMSSGKNEATYEEEDLANTDALYFPKEFNESQVAIIRRLETSEGVVVQGPPGTGKTHTIANVICHYLATGRRVLVTSKGEPALEVLRDHIPKEIRDLSISLLTSEREGLRQLEVAVNTLASTVNNMNPRTVEQQIFDKESQIRQLRGKIAQVEAEMAEWARKQLSPVDKSILGNLDVLTPAKLAERVVANRERSAWFADQLGLEPRFEPRFTDADIAAVRAARKTLEADLVYSQHTLPSPNDLMDAAALAAIHEDLVNADRLQRVALEENVPLMSLSVERALEHAAEALEELVEMIEHRRAIADKPWLNVLFKKWHRFGFKGQDTDLMSERVEGALSRFMAHVRKIGGGKGVRTPRIRRDARSAMEDCYAAIPCWIMPTWRVSESLPATLGAFDLVIVDEASQSDIGALPALLRGKKLMIVGDDKQVSPTAAFVEERKLLQLRHNFLDGQPHASLMLPGSSLYDLANSIFPGRRVMLQEHFRCVEPIIRFSFQFYTEPIIPLRIPKASERLDPPLIDVYLPHGSRNRQKINHTEAVAIVDEIERLVNDPSYKERSMGVVSLIGAEQAQYIQKLLLERIGAAKFLEHRITCGDSATFQGKERDIMFVSMVASPGQAVSQTSLIFQQRFNVALSRARDRMYLFRSVEEKDLNPKDLKAKVIAHFREPMVRADKKMEDLISLCESDFERKVFRRLVNLGYRVTPQVSVGPFRIDLVVEGANDRRLAVELDGDRHHGPERWAEDLTRQRTLERVGWRFWRCWASSFELDPEGCMRDLVETLQSQGIEPIGHVNRQNIYTEHRVIRPPSDSVEVTAGNGEIEVIGTGDEPRPELAADIDVAVTRPAGVVVELQDRVVISYNDEPTRQRTVIISPTQNDPGNGILNTSHPLAVALLGHSVDDEIEIESSSGTRTVIVQAIEKAVAFGNGLGQRNEISEQQDTKPGNNQPETSQLYGQNLPTGQLYREHGAKTVSEENQPQVETQPSETEEQHNQSPSKDMVDLQDQSGIRNTVPIEIPTDSSARESLSNTAPRRDGQTTREPNLEALDLVRRAREVIQAKGNGQPGKGSFTNQERATIKKILGMDRGDLTLAIVFLQKIELGREGREKG